METQELTVKVQEVIAKSGIGLEIDVTELHSLAKKASAITSVNDEGFATVKKELQLKRKEISEGMLEARSEFTRMAKGIIEVEKTLLEIFVPAEQNLIALDKAEKERVLKEERLAALPAKRERITTAGIEFTDEEILAMTDADFELAFATKLAEKAEADRLAAEAKLAEERAAFEAEKAELARKQAEADAIEAARKEEQERAEQRLRLERERAEREKRELEERRLREAREAEERRKAEEQERLLRIEREAKEAEERRKAEEQERLLRIEREAKEAEEAKIRAEREAREAEAKRAADEKWQAFLKANNFNEATDVVLGNGDNGEYRIYRLVAEFKN